MFVFLKLKHLLLQVLPSPAMTAQCSLLHIQNHLAMVSDSLWAINSMINIPEMGQLHKLYLKNRWAQDCVLDLPTEFTDWKKDVDVAIEDVGELLGRILDWEASLHHSILGNIQQKHFRRVVLGELKELLCDLNSLVLRGSAMSLPRDLLHSMNPLRKDYSNVLKKEVVGREEDVKKLIAIFQQQQLLVSSDSNGDDNNPFVVAIVGDPWIGKTTLAHMIYHHAWLRQQFHHRIWVDLPSSSSFETINIIAKKFARSISNEEHCDEKLHVDLPLQALWEYVNEQLDGSRFFLVLHCGKFDEVLREKWVELKNILLHVGGPGSAVLITNHSRIASDFTMYYLNPLPKDAWVELFKRHATTLIPSSKQVKRLFQYCNGHPFPAKICGLSSHHFRSFFLDDFIKSVYKLTLVSVRLNQYSELLVANILDTHEVMLHMLIADYLIPDEGLASDLVDHSIRILQEEINGLGGVSEYLFANMLYLRLKVPEESTTIPSRCRYLCLKINATARQFRLPTMSVEVSNKLITLILQEDEEMTKEDRAYQKGRMKTATAISEFLKEMLVKLVHLRILIIETSMIQSLPSEVRKLVNLRYLHLSKNKMELLPNSLFDLTNLRIFSLLRCPKLRKIPERLYKLKKLQILKLAHCTKLQQLPKSITRLQNLRELNVEGCYWLSELPEDLVSFKWIEILNVTGCASLSRIPRGIEKSIGLRKLSGVFISANGGLEFAQLQALTNLRDLGLRNLERVEETQTEVLMGQQRLRNLLLHWGGEEANESFESTTPLQVLEALRPYGHLQRLEIISYKEEKFPFWMSKQELTHFDSLVEVRLINLKKCATLPSLGQLPNLEKLEISGMDLIKQIHETFYGDDDNMFPKLKELIFSEMLALEKLSVPKTTKLFLSLDILTLIQCPKLKEIDPLEPEYSNLTMRICLNNETIWSAEFSSWNNLHCIVKIEIFGCQELRCLPQGMRSLKYLSELTINGCNNLTTLVALDLLEILHIYDCPMLSFNSEAFTGLGVLHIYACPMVSFNIEAFTRLYELEIEGCPKMQIYYNAWKEKTGMRNRSNEEEYDNSNSNEEEECDNSNSKEEIQGEEKGGRGGEDEEEEEEDDEEEEDEDEDEEEEEDEEEDEEEEEEDDDDNEEEGGG